MRMLPSLLVASLLTLAVAAPANAELLTLGSDLSKPASLIESQGADTAFWPVNVNGTLVSVPEAGQVVAIKIKGAAQRETGAPNDPATLIHFQTLEPAAADGSRTVFLTSGDYHMPVGDPNQITEFKPVNLCVNKGGSLAFNTIGGFRWGGSFEAPLGQHYLNGTPWQMFAPVSTSSTAWFSKDNGTNNGATLSPNGGTDAHTGFGRVIEGRELLMQLVVATGDDRSTACGGPGVDSNGNKVEAMSVNPNQDMYVTRDGAFSILGFCGSRRGDCTGGTATVTIGGKVVSTGAFSVKQNETIKVAMKLSSADYIALANSPNATQDAIVTLTNYLGVFTGAIKLHTTKGGALALKAQKPYVSNDRTLKPYAICSLPTGCAGKATLTSKGKTLATSRFKTRKRGAILFKMKLKSSTFKALKRAGTLVATLTVTSNAGTQSTQVVLRK